LAAVPAAAEPVWHQLTVRTAARDRLRQHLLDQGIGSAIFYPIPLHRQPALERFVRADLDLPQAETAAREVLSLPLYPQLQESQVDEVCAAVRAFFGD
jgi:dTDP-4-amino-4,6-dideoxygalactose transaminase